MILHTERLLLRPFAPGDLADVFAYYSQPGVPEPAGRAAQTDRAQTAALLEGFCRTPDYLAVVDAATGRVIGQLHIKPDSDEGRADTRELGCILNRAYHRRGLMTEALNAVLDALFAQGIEQVYACCFEENLASRGMIERLGFQFAQMGEYHIGYLDKTVSSREYLMTRPAWAALRGAAQNSRGGCNA